MAGHEFGVVFDVGRDAEVAPVGRDGADAVGADGDDLLDFRRVQLLQAMLGEVLEDEVVAETAGGIAGTFFFLEDAEAGAEVGHDAGEVGDDLAAVRVVGAHAAEPEAVFLGAVEDGELGAGDELVAFGGGQAESVAGFLQCEEELGAVGVLPCAGVGGAATQADDDGQVLDAHRTLDTRRRRRWCTRMPLPASMWLRWEKQIPPPSTGLGYGMTNHGAEVGEEGDIGGGAEGVEVGAGAEDDLLGVEDLAGGGGGAVLGAATALDATIGLQGDDLGEVATGGEAEVFHGLVGGERRDGGEAERLRKMVTGESRR